MRCVERCVCIWHAAAAAAALTSVHRHGIRVWVRRKRQLNRVALSLGANEIAKLGTINRAARTSRSHSHTLDNAPISTRINDLLNYPDRCP